MRNVWGLCPVCDRWFYLTEADAYCPTCGQSPSQELNVDVVRGLVRAPPTVGRRQAVRRRTASVTVA